MKAKNKCELMCIYTKLVGLYLLVLTYDTML